MPNVTTEIRITETVGGEDVVFSSHGEGCLSGVDKRSFLEAMEEVCLDHLHQQTNGSMQVKIETFDDDGRIPNSSGAGNLTLKECFSLERDLLVRQLARLDAKIESEA